MYSTQATSQLRVCIGYIYNNGTMKHVESSLKPQKLFYFIEHLLNV